MSVGVSRGGARRVFAHDWGDMARVRDAESWDAGQYARDSRFVSDLGEPLIALLAPAAGERILDLGCGDGALSVKLAAWGCSVVGIDSSASMAAAARARGLDCRVADAAALPFRAEFDGVFSNAALHWILAPDTVLAAVARALKPGGRFVGEFGGAGNVSAIVRALRAALAGGGADFDELSPWYFPSPEEYRGRLERAGFRVTAIDLFARPTPLPGDISAWLKIFAAPFIEAPDGGADAMYDELRERLRPELWDGEKWTVDYVRLRFAAVLDAA